MAHCWPPPRWHQFALPPGSHGVPIDRLSGVAKDRLVGTSVSKDRQSRTAPRSGQDLVEDGNFFGIGPDVNHQAAGVEEAHLHDVEAFAFAFGGEAAERVSLARKSRTSKVRVLLVASANSPVTLATRADEAGGPPPQVLRATGQPPSTTRRGGVAEPQRGLTSAGFHGPTGGAWRPVVSSGSPHGQ